MHSFRIEFAPSRHATQNMTTPINAKKEELPLELLFFKSNGYVRNDLAYQLVVEQTLGDVLERTAASLNTEDGKPNCSEDGKRRVDDVATGGTQSGGHEERNPHRAQDATQAAEGVSNTGAADTKS